MLPLLAVSRAWQAALRRQPPAAPLVALLAGLNERLGSQWGAFVSAQVAAVEQYEGRSKMGLQQGEGARVMALLLALRAELAALACRDLRSHMHA